MITNLVASILVSIVTNTTELIVQPAQTFYVCVVLGCEEDHNKQDPLKQTKTITTTCKEITALRFEWNGPREVVSERVLWQSNQVLNLQWK